MYHSVYFSYKSGASAIDSRLKSITRNSWTDFYMIPSTRPVINPPKVRTNYTELAGAFGQLDFTDVLTGYPLYNTRTGSLEFIVDNGHEEWYSIYSSIMSWVHGKKMYMVLEDEIDWHYTGRLSVNSWKSEQHNSKIQIDYELDPFKYYIYDTSMDWLWDQFNFETGVTYSDIFKEIEVDGELTIPLYGCIGDKPSTPNFIVSDSNQGLSIEYVNTYLGLSVRETFENGEHVDPNYVLYDPGYSVSDIDLYLKIVGTGKLSVVFHPAKL